jgi:hypothetical protein
MRLHSAKRARLDATLRRDMDLNEAIGQFDAAETTLRRLENTWEEIRALTPDGIIFEGDSDRGLAYEDLCRTFHDLVAGLPAIDEFRITAEPIPLDEIAQARFDAQEIAMLEAINDVEAWVAAPGEQVREYRHRFNRARRAMARGRLLVLMAEVDSTLAALVGGVEPTRDPVPEPEWSQLSERFGEIERLAGSSTPRKGRWGELRRHLAWAQGVDLHDIATHDWPSVRADIERSLYAENEPVPVSVADLGALAETKPTGRVSTALNWKALDPEQFERLVFELISEEPGYQNALWPTKTNAPDGGRDLYVERVHDDPLSGPRTQRVIVSCKHWQSKSIDPEEIHSALARVKASGPPTVDVLVIATSGRFTGDAMKYISQHNHEREKPEINPWPESHLEMLLARRPELVPAGLRSG